VQRTIAYKEIGDHKDMIAQLGFVRSLQMSLGLFESAEFTAVFEANGRLVSSGYEETSAPSEAALGALGGVASAAQGYLQTRADVREAKAAAQQTASDAELKRLQTQLAIADLNQKLAPPSLPQNSINTLNMETDLLNAQIAKLRAEKLLLDLQQQ